MKKHIFRFAIFTLICLFFCMLSVEFVYAGIEASIILDIDLNENGLMRDIAATATRFYVLFAGRQPEIGGTSNSGSSYIRKVYVFDHEGTRKPDEEFEIDTELTPYSIAVTNKFIYISYWDSSGIDAYAFDGTRLHDEGLRYASAGQKSSIAATETHIYVSDVSYLDEVDIYKFKDTQGDLNARNVSWEKEFKLTTNESLRAFIAATDTRVYIQNPNDSTIYVYDTRDGGRRAREDFVHCLWTGLRKESIYVPSRYLSGITTTPLGGKLYMLISRSRDDGIEGRQLKVYRYSIPEENAARPEVFLPAKPPRRASYYFYLPPSGSGIAATDTTVYIGADGSRYFGRAATIHAETYSDGVPGSLFADAGKLRGNISVTYPHLGSSGMTVDYNNIYLLIRRASDVLTQEHNYAVRHCLLNSDGTIHGGKTTLRDLQLPLAMENFKNGIGLAIDSEGILYVMAAGENYKGPPLIYRYKPSLDSPQHSQALPGNPILLHPDHKAPCGITIVKNRAYVLDRAFITDEGTPRLYAKVFVYDLDAHDVFEYLPEESFLVNARIGNQTIIPYDSGIAVNGDTFFISMRAEWPSNYKHVLVYGPLAAPSWGPIRADTIQRRQPYGGDIRRMSIVATNGSDYYKYQAIEGIPWILSLDFDFVFGNPDPSITFKTGYKKPEWLTLKDGVLSGTPSSAGKLTIELTATNEQGSTDESITLNVGPGVVAPSWHDFSVPEIRIHDAWSLTLTDLVTGNPTPEIYFTQGYTPPDWLKLREGVLSGTPPKAGTYSIQVTAASALRRPGYVKWADIVIYLVVKGPTSPNWALDSMNDTAQGIAATDNRIYVTDLIDDKIYVYGHDGERYVAQDIDLKTLTENPIGITATVTHIYIVDNSEDIVSILDVTETGSVGNFKLDPDNRGPTGIAATARRLYVVDHEDDKVYTYAHDGTRHPTEDVNLHKHSEPTGITATATRLYVVDGDDDKIYPYEYDGKMKNSEIVELVTENRSPTGVTATPAHLFVADIIDQKVYSYPIPGVTEVVVTVGAPSWKPVSIPEAVKGSHWTLSLADFVKGDPTPQIYFTDGYTSSNWLTLQNGVLSGTPTMANTEYIKVTATNSKGSADITVPLSVSHSEYTSWDLNPEEIYVNTIASTEEFVYVFYGTQNNIPHISAYTHDGIRRPDKDIKLGTEHRKDSHSINTHITASETHLFMVETYNDSDESNPTGGRKVYVFDITGTGTKRHFFLSREVGMYTAEIAATTTRFYAVNWSERKFHVYGHDGTPYPNEDFTLKPHDTEGTFFLDVATTETRIYVLLAKVNGYVRGKVFVYGHDGTPYPDENFNVGEVKTVDITATSTHLMAYSGPYLRGINTGSIFYFPLPEAEGNTETAVHIQDTTPAWDVNQDGKVDIQDLIKVAQYIDETELSNPQADVNGDGTIDVQDLLIVSQHLGESAEAASPIKTTALRFPALVKNVADGDVTTELIQTWIDLARISDDGSPVFQRGIANLERLLAEMLPDKTELLANYPNPFNPETWIPYHLAKEAEVQITIYDINGAVVRQLDLGLKLADNYTDRSRAAFWDGRNADGEKVASGIYFYQLRAGGYDHTRRMLIVK